MYAFDLELWFRTSKIFKFIFYTVVFCISALFAVFIVALSRS
jgi:hypothetical protein